MQLEGKTALVPGGGTGIGQAIALLLAAEGCRVAIVGRREEKLREASLRWQGNPPYSITREMSRNEAVSIISAPG